MTNETTMNSSIACPDCHFGWNDFTFGQHYDHCPQLKAAETVTEVGAARYGWNYEEIAGKHGVFEGNLLVAIVGECAARPEYATMHAKQIVNDHNNHARLTEALRGMVMLMDWIIEDTPKLKLYNADKQKIKEARAVLDSLKEKP